MPVQTTTDTTTALTDAKNQTSHGLIVQGYCLSVLKQPAIDFKSVGDLQRHQDRINAGLKKAQGHADSYINDIQPRIITNITGMDDYFRLTAKIPTMCPPGSSTDQWLKVLNAVKTRVDDYQKTSVKLASDLSGLSINIAQDSGEFGGIVTDLNDTVNGDNGVLDDIRKKLKSLNAKEGGAIAGVVLGGLAVAGGVLMIITGSVAAFITAGTSIPLIIGGVAVLAVGIGAVAVSGAFLAKHLREKRDILTQQSILKSEVKLALGASNAYRELGENADQAATSALKMANTWTLLSGDLGNMSKDLNDGITDGDILRQFFLGQANDKIPVALEDISNIKKQMAGVETKVLPLPAPNSDGQVLANYLEAEAKTERLAA